ncbi:hypothetical protein COEREDRAFT_79367 [Coemansia reversa NRRL 1564]|uniref:Uncharacterized protein n=1 Tax=Coemansia reversa (strain ATCC 12441 / NRRL 1564) TaxID=763665 RepID=A0A2G5BIG7_COERN|nr:hypothetical protein COEREDRAFT_79367 [Coemansia reversa NRRL 1564]|eukprot:PIA18795.1 hypothetical protein COEREDRAFT_79367 [Coemansia reversa NRRL 1564]
MDTITANYADNSAKTAPFAIKSNSVSDTKSLVTALEVMQFELNAKFTTLINAEKASSTPSTTSTEQDCQCKKQKV